MLWNISNALDGTEDDAIWEEDGAEAAKSADEEDDVGDDVYDDQTSYEQMNELFDEEEEGEFYGFDDDDEL